MKKLMITAAIVCVVAVSHAASIVWGGDIADATCTTAISGGSTAYLIRSSTLAGAAVNEITVSGADYTAWTTDTGASIVSSYTIDSPTAAAWSFNDTYTVKGTEDVGYYSIVVVDGGVGEDGETGSYNYAGYNEYSSATSGDQSVLTVGDGTWQNWIGKGGFEQVSFVASVPEPTSGLLLLLGMAGLALRRRRA